MNTGLVRLSKTHSDLLESAHLSDWIENSRIVGVTGRVFRQFRKIQILRNFDGRMFVKIDPYYDPDQRVAALLPGIYFDVGSGARLADCSRIAIREGMHNIWSVIRMCRSKELLRQNQSLWVARRKLLQALSDSFNHLDVGTYEAKESSPYADHVTRFKSSLEHIRRPDYAAGEISETEKQMLRRQINNWQRRVARTETLEPVGLKTSINSLYHAFGLPNPRIVIVKSPLVLALASTLATALCFAKDPRRSATDQAEQSFFALATSEIIEATTERAFQAVGDSIAAETFNQVTKFLDASGITQATRSFSGAAGAAIDNALADISDPSSANIVRDQSQLFRSTIAEEVIQATCYASRTAYLQSPEPALKRIFSKMAHLAESNEVTPTHLVQGLGTEHKDKRAVMYACLKDCSRKLQVGNRQRYNECLTTILSEVFGLKLAAPEHNALWQKVVTKCGAIVLHEQFCIVSDFPEIVNLDEQGRPHCPDGPSYVFRDGWSLYHWHGIRVAKQVIEAMETITVDDIQREPNLEVRRIMLDRYGTKRYLVDSKAAEIHRDECGILYRQDLHPALEPLVMVKVVNSTAEPDGTFKDYFLRVPPQVRTAREAVAWTFGVDGNHYQPGLQT